MTRELIIECMTCKEECEEENSCFECAEKQLAEYEKQIRADAIDEFADKCIESQRALFVNPSVKELDMFKTWVYIVAEALKEQK